MIQAGNQQIPVKGVYQEKQYYMDAMRPVLRVELEGGVTDEQLDALKNNDWELYNGEAHEGTQQGYHTLIGHTLLFAKVESAEQQLITAQAEHAQQIQALQDEVEAQRLEMELVLQEAREGLVSVPEQGESWDANKRYTTGDTVTHDGVLYTALRLSRNREPGRGTLYWAKQQTEQTFPAWSEIADGTVIAEGFVCTHDGQNWACVSQHIKSVVFKPKMSSGKWEMI